MRKKIKNIIIEEFSNLIHLIDKDFKKLYNKKAENFLLNGLETSITANMAFVSSFESKYGNAIETCAKRITKLRYGNENVPDIINPKAIPHNLTLNNNTQYIITNVDINNGDLDGEISRFRSNNEAEGRGRKRKESGVTKSSILEVLIPLNQKYTSNHAHAKPVDLAFFDGKNWNIMELKAGGNLDSSNAPSNVEKLLKIYTCLGLENTKMYFATCYNKNGEGKTWTGAVKKHLCFPEMFLIGSELWKKILPQNITFEEFTEIYRESLSEIDINKKVRELMDSVS